jgi:hypothetical protein
MIFTVISLAGLFGEYFDATGQIVIDPSMSLRTDKRDNKLGNTVFSVVVFWHSRFLQQSL